MFPFKRWLCLVHRKMSIYLQTFYSIISVSQIDFWNMNASILLWVQWCHIKTYYIFPGSKIPLILPQASHSSSLFLVPTTSPPAVFMIIHNFRKET